MCDVTGVWYNEKRLCNEGVIYMKVWYNRGILCIYSYLFQQDFEAPTFLLRRSPLHPCRRAWTTARLVARWTSGPVAGSSLVSGEPSSCDWETWTWSRPLNGRLSLGMGVALLEGCLLGLLTPAQQLGQSREGALRPADVYAASGPGPSHWQQRIGPGPGQSQRIES
jgi:hypothetical protein